MYNTGGRAYYARPPECSPFLKISYLHGRSLVLFYSKILRVAQVFDRVPPMGEPSGRGLWSRISLEIPCCLCLELWF